MIHSFIPNCTLPAESKRLLLDMIAYARINNKPLLTALNQALEAGYSFYVVDQARGRCYFSRKVISVPLWAYIRSADYKTWYFCHELSHFLAYKNSKHNGHGKAFMQELISICPKEALHFETSYKPKNAVAAGISFSVHVNCGTVPSDFF